MRFADHLDHNGGHWMWTASLNHAGYGRFAWTKTKGVAAHRAAWMLFRGEIPDGLQVHHTCYVRACVNPRHLELRTPGENTRDSSPERKPRKPKGQHQTLKAVCKNGHPMEGDNVVWRTDTAQGRARTAAGKRPFRYCRECSRESNRRQHARRRAAHGVGT